ncbi:MAG: asparagine synthase (glutamine-hydrolyzing), partial [Lachnospiraceae bacterium]|nr:asparagine synthase (glutamine-hydrolyzing) [Lachnospiraceae bacterium]
MCGIAGFCNLYKDRSGREETIRRMTDHIKERGPDAEGAAYYEYPLPGSGDGTVCDITMGHRRLAIIDLTESGAQPMRSHSGRLSIVYNGEIYDHLDLKRELEEAGIVRSEDWRGTSDTEILLEAIEAWGLSETLKKCRGMCAIAVFDHETGRIRLARDRVGEKPLYYGFVHRKGDGKSDPPVFAFASDVGCFREIEGFCNEIRRAVLPLYFVHGYIPAPYTIYRDLWKLEPGTILTIEAPYSYFDPQEELDAIERMELGRKGSLPESGSHHYETYWSMWEIMQEGQCHPFTGSLQEASEELERLLKAAIRRQMVADVPLGAFLSAGIDSSTIVSLMQEVSREDGGRPVRTFTIGMREEGFNEAPIAKEIAAHLGTDHTEKYITKEDALAVIPKLKHMFGEPFADSSQIPTYLVSQMTREHVTVSLSGDAGDELFCGYTSYLSIKRIWDKMKRVPAPIRRLAGTVLLLLPQVRANEIRRAKAGFLKARSPVELHRLESDHEPIIGRIALPVPDGEELPHKLTQITNRTFWRMGADTKAAQAGSDADWAVPFRETMLADLIFYHPDDILVKVDRCAMANSLETRVPLLDPDVIAFAWSLPTEYLTQMVEGRQGEKV